MKKNLYFYLSAGYSEDSDYTSDLNYPIGHMANSSASQYRNLQTPQRSLEVSRENSYERDDQYNTYSGLNSSKTNEMTTIGVSKSCHQTFERYGK